MVLDFDTWILDYENWVLAWPTAVCYCVMIMEKLTFFHGYNVLFPQPVEIKWVPANYCFEGYHRSGNGQGKIIILRSGKFILKQGKLT